MNWITRWKKIGIKVKQIIKKCKQVGVDGLIVVDLPSPENKSFSKKCKKNFINFIQLISPTTSKYRMKRIINDSHDMIYYISMLSTTGGKLKVSPKKISKSIKNRQNPVTKVGNMVKNLREKLS